ncbi:valine--tRNA ligase [candidate division WWE3 bacterium RIFOXYA2_FULL_46_9]|uniref:Valine--tRNA ligase n=1 Tax=candidate division WWE3 bacterium RIFOXYA2_FULL_46_9 TaxID=1802636 RepID=A0A1F4W110_UNCKA|nr:MAG: valine--tRNA ligase [candidate division WWE3 bacterium RIFOXYA2_FULL_46_9]OGC64968.1 MAG: valine--tRNA ligase [candidate division WWE3 bacterium RIFOXYB2_FULL_41_6]HLD51518.1 valine--tRNA ligase [Patescibacteria group bacterium]
MDTKFDHTKIEDEIYQKWQNDGVFSPEKSFEIRKKAGLEVKNENFSVLMPPPNANAALHCGHATYAIQDLMARYKRMCGFKTLYLPGVDHAGFETQVVYERKLKKEGKSRFDFDRQTLFNNILEFVKQNSDVAVNQLRKIGMSADWDRTVFMLDDRVVNTVYDTFERMYKEGLVYRSDYLVNYSPFHGTTFSNLETTHIEQKDPLYYIKYGPFVLATVRPETKFGDTAVAVNPKDERYKEWIGKEIEVEGLVGIFKLKVIADSYVDPEFGTGVVKVTPAHDPADFEAGLRHGLEAISVIGLDGRLNQLCGKYAGMKVLEARKAIAEDLRNAGLLVKVDETYTHNIVVDYKDHKPIEPMLLPNWFIKMDGLSKEALKAVREGKVKFNKPTWKKQMITWLENTRDWPVSRQIVFGIRIPVWYSYTENPSMHVVFIDEKGISHDGKLSELIKQGFSLSQVIEGLQKLIAPKDAKFIVSRISPGEDFIQDTDTFDTWFSSGQWPLTTLHYPNGEDFKEYYPTSFMDSMWDILFFWLARMLMFGMYLGKQVPFKQVYVHGRIDDEFGRKMSKSLGNVIDPLEYIAKYGADALRMGILVGGNTSAKNTSLSEAKVKGYRNFANKLWNMARFTIMMIDSLEGTLPDINNILDLTEEDKLMMGNLEKTVKSVTKHIDKLRFQLAGDEVYQFVWHDVADKYIELVKNREGEEKTKGLVILKHVMLTCIKLLHPFMPFVTEAIWENLDKDNKVCLALSEWPK